MELGIRRRDRKNDGKTDEVYEINMNSTENLIQDKSESKIRALKAGVETAFINDNAGSNLAYRPEFVSNDISKGKKVLATLENELLNCDEFKISVAFIEKLK